jgi:hypothetical protein
LTLPAEQAPGRRAFPTRPAPALGKKEKAGAVSGFGKNG